MLDPELIRDNLARVREAVGPGVEILAATKYVEAADLPALAAGGVALVGENRSDALLEKQALHGPLFTWDFIGQLQSRKVRDIVGRVRLIHSVGSLSACSQVQARAEAPADCLLEVNVAGEGTKAGVPLAEVDGFLEQVEELDRVRFRGLMTMPPLAATPDEARPWFAALRAERDRLAARWAGRHEFSELSMGTSQDYRVAAEEGASLVRVGSILWSD